MTSPTPPAERAREEKIDPAVTAAEKRIARFLAKKHKRISPEVVHRRRIKAARVYPPEWMRTLLRDQHSRCAYCGVLIARSPHRCLPALQATIDHVVPISAGGRNERSNVVASCGPCNTAKGNMSAAEFRAALSDGDG